MDNNEQINQIPVQPQNQKKLNWLPWVLLAVVSIIAVVAIGTSIFLAVRLNNTASEDVDTNTAKMSEVDETVKTKVNAEPETDEKTSGTIEEILGVDLDDIAFIKVGGAWEQTEDYPVEDFLEEYGEATYNKVNKGYGSTSHMYYVCYNKSGKILFTLVDVGNQDLVFLEKGLFNINDAEIELYQMER